MGNNLAFKMTFEHIKANTKFALCEIRSDFFVFWASEDDVCLTSSLRSTMVTLFLGYNKDH
jgi:hypothetical protein